MIQQATYQQRVKKIGKFQIYLRQMIKAMLYGQKLIRKKIQKKLKILSVNVYGKLFINNNQVMMKDPLSKESGGIFMREKKSLRYLMYFNLMILRSLQKVLLTFLPALLGEYSMLVMKVIDLMLLQYYQTHGKKDQSILI